MGRCIEIKKIDGDKNIYLYHVTTNDFDGADFIIKINKESQEVYFFENDYTAQPAMKYDLKTQTWHYFLSSNINEKVLPYVVLQSYKAIRDDHFPNHIGYAA